MSITLSTPPAIVQQVQYYDALIVSAAEKLGCHEIVGEFLANTYRAGGEIGNTLFKVYWMCRCSHFRLAIYEQLCQLPFENNPPAVRLSQYSS